MFLLPRTSFWAFLISMDALLHKRLFVLTLFLEYCGDLLLLDKMMMMMIYHVLNLEMQKVFTAREGHDA